MSEPSPPSLTRPFVRRTAFVFFVAAGLFLAWQLASVFLLLFAAIVVAVLIRTIADPLRDHTPLNEPASLAAAGVVLLLVLGGAGWLFQSVLGAQLGDLAARLPHSMAQLDADVARLPFGGQLLSRLENAQDLSARFQGLAGRIGGYAISVAGALTDLVLVIFAGAFLAIEPARSRDGLLLLLPQEPRPAVREALDASGRALKLWLRGVLVDMAAVGVLTAAGAYAVGLPSPIALGVIAALLDFVPFIGPVVSIVPGLLLAITLGPSTIVWTLVMYVAVQQIEGNLIYPFIQRRAVDLPPVLSLVAVLAFGVLLGPLGVVLATPLLVVCFTMVKLLYVRNTLGEPTAIPGERRGAQPA